MAGLLLGPTKMYIVIACLAALLALALLQASCTLYKASRKRTTKVRDAPRAKSLGSMRFLSKSYCVYFVCRFQCLRFDLAMRKIERKKKETRVWHTLPTRRVSPIFRIFLNATFSALSYIRIQSSTSLFLSLFLYTFSLPTRIPIRLVLACTHLVLPISLTIHVFTTIKLQGRLKNE